MARDQHLLGHDPGDDRHAAGAGDPPAPAFMRGLPISIEEEAVDGANTVQGLFRVVVLMLKRMVAGSVK